MILPSPPVEKLESLTFGLGMYWSKCFAGSDQARCGTTALGNTHWDGDVQPGV
jgi:hypothetical protein